MGFKYGEVPDLKNPEKWIELEVKREFIYVESGTLLLPIGEKRYYRQMVNGKLSMGIAMATIFFNKEPILISWSYPSLNNYELGYMALKMKTGKWAISNPLINGTSVEEDKNILHVHKYRKTVWVMLKAKKGWLVRKIRQPAEKNNS